MKRIISLLIFASILFSLTACSHGSLRRNISTYEQPNELALITDHGNINDLSFNNAAWDGLVKYARENNINHNYYKPANTSDEAYLSSIALAVKGGAKVIVTPGILFQSAVYEAQTMYPDVSFILIDASPVSKDNGDNNIAPNTVAVSYAEEQAGFLAGYAAVKNGATELGFMGGMELPPVISFGYGFIQGADYAAQELKLASGVVEINYHYTGAFDATPAAQSMAENWYLSGTEVIFGCGGAVGNSVMSAAEALDKSVIGVDVDQSSQSETVITSATKGIQSSVYRCIADYYSGNFPGGQRIKLAADNDGIGLVMNSSKLENFSQQDYDLIYGKLADGTISLHKDMDENCNPLSIEDLGLNQVSVFLIT